jgi:hypothetical protein
LYQELIDNYIQKRYDKHQEERGSDKGEWHPSSLTGCPRAAVYDYKGYEESDPTEMRSMRIMDRGTEVHEFIQAMVTESIIAKEGQPSDFLPEVKVDHAGIKGSCDGLLKVDGDLYEVQEYKSIGPNGKKYLYPKPYGKRGPGNVPQAKPEHIKQARIYHRGLKAMGYAVTDWCTIVYIDRDDWSVLEFRVNAWSDVEWYEFLAEIADLEDNVHEGTLPDRPAEYERTKFPCSYCNFNTRCWEND